MIKLIEKIIYIFVSKEKCYSIVIYRFTILAKLWKSKFMYFKKIFVKNYTLSKKKCLQKENFMKKVILNPQKGEKIKPLFPMFIDLILNKQ